MNLPTMKDGKVKVYAQFLAVTAEDGLKFFDLKNNTVNYVFTTKRGLEVALLVGKENERKAEGLLLQMMS